MINVKNILKGVVILCLIIPTISYAQEESQPVPVDNQPVVEAPDKEKPEFRKRPKNDERKIDQEESPELREKPSDDRRKIGQEEKSEFRKKPNLVDELDLSRKQIKRLRKHRKKFKGKRDKLNERIVMKKAQISDELLKEDVDDDKIKRLTDDLDKLSKDARKHAIDSTKDLKKILTKDQRKELKRKSYNRDNVKKENFNRERDGVKNKKDFKRDSKRYIKDDKRKTRKKIKPRDEERGRQERSNP